MPLTKDIYTALATVNDPEIHRPITDLGMVEDVVLDGGNVLVKLLLTVAGCPLKATLNRDITSAVSAVEGVTNVRVEMGVMSEEQRKNLQEQLRGGAAHAKEIPFAQPGSRTRVYAVASGKGGVGKSSVTVNLAAALAAKGLTVGVVDADIYGFSIPRMLGVTERPTRVEDMIMPPTAHGIRVISIGMFVDNNAAVVWRGPMLHRALQQFLSDVYWGELDVLLMDLPPGTGDIAISAAQLLPSAEILVVTTPQDAAAEVAERAGSIAVQTHQHVLGVIENMSYLTLPDGKKLDVFGEGGGEKVSAGLTKLLGTQVPLLGQIPLEPGLREAADNGQPFVTLKPDDPASQALSAIADKLAARQESIVGKPLSLSVA